MPFLFKKKRQYKITDLIPLKDTLDQLPDEVDYSQIVVFKFEDKNYVLRGLEHLVKAYSQGAIIVRADYHGYTTYSAKQLVAKKVGDATSVADFGFTLEDAPILTPPQPFLDPEVFDNDIEEIKVETKEVEVETEKVEVETEKVEVEEVPCTPELGGTNIKECMEICAASGGCSSEECYNACRLYFEKENA